MHTDLSAAVSAGGGALRRVPPADHPPPSRGFATLSDDELHARVRECVAKSNVALARLIAHLGEVEARGIHRERACATLRAYCVYELRMSEDAADKRVRASRIARELPVVIDKLASGEIHLTGLLMLGSYLEPDNHEELLARARFRTKREIQKLIREIDPLAALPSRVEPLGPAEPNRVRAPSAAEFNVALAGPVRELREGDRPGDWVRDAGGSAPEQDGAPGGVGSAPESPELGRSGA